MCAGITQANGKVNNCGVVRCVRGDYAGGELQGRPISINTVLAPEQRWRAAPKPCSRGPALHLI